ncbi:hypothetical protein JE040_11385 [Enterococcus xinjiangensis]|uniref:hypothetical protein n=1 Tax=Enterococcus TaxID=1350 RepID=UPI000D38ABBE|nr:MULTISPECIES: hypothetical protein [Enterococcus]MBK1999430.1 hypothetical protein [Enterococcus lactis]PWQ89825.1 hypothetical protein DKX15_11805 [Enterococcus faecium]RAX29953.1 hypothetical protein DQE80_11870 [Enterococcus sp. HPCN18]
MELVYLGSEIKLSEYLYRYEEMVRYAVQELSFADLSSDRAKTLLKAELRKAETSWYEFYSANRRGPDYAYLQEQIIDFGSSRLDLFDCRDEELTEDNFVHYHIESLKSEKLLSVFQFEEVDLQFIEEHERKRASKYFNERNQYLKGYENDRISVNETMQRIGYQQLRQSFLTDPLIESYRK